MRQAIAMIAELYAVEKRTNTGPPEDRVRSRNEESRPIVKRIEQWALSVRSLPGSGLRNAIEYMGHMWNEGLRRFLDDPNVPIDKIDASYCTSYAISDRARRARPHAAGVSDGFSHDRILARIVVHEFALVVKDAPAQKAPLAPSLESGERDV